MHEANGDDKEIEDTPDKDMLNRERYELLQRLAAWMEMPMLILAFIWLALLVRELVWGESPAFEIIGMTIWVIFILDFVVEFMLAPHKRVYLKHNWLTAIALLIPALRIFRVIRLLQVGRGLRLLRIVTSLNRGMRALGASLRRRGFGYVIAFTLLVTVAGAAGMYAFENGVPGGFDSYGEALWWTAMIMTTMGSQYWPQTFEGRSLCVFLALYAFTVFGYVTAALATYFIGRDAENDDAEVAGSKEIAALRAEVIALRSQIHDLISRAWPDE